MLFEISSGMALARGPLIESGCCRGSIENTACGCIAKVYAVTERSRDRQQAQKCRPRRPRFHDGYPLVNSVAGEPHDTTGVFDDERMTAAAGRHAGVGQDVADFL